MGEAASDTNTYLVANTQLIEEAEGWADVRKNALERFQKIMVGQQILGAVLLLCGILLLVNYNSDAYPGPPYYIGGMVTGPLLLVGALSTFMLRRHAPNYDQSDMAKRQTRCDMRCIQMTTMLTFMTCLAGIFILGISGIFSDAVCFSCEVDRYKRSNTIEAIALVVLLVLAFVFAIFIMYSFCTTATVFGVVVDTRRGILIRQEQLLATQIAVNQQLMNQLMNREGTTYGATFTANIGATGNTQSMSDLLRQNLLLQQQVQNMLQQQQQQSAYPPTGFTQQEPPPRYETVAGYYPPAPACSGPNIPSAPTELDGLYTNDSNFK